MPTQRDQTRPSRPSSRVLSRLAILALPFLAIGIYALVLTGQRGAPFVAFALEAQLSGRSGTVAARLDPEAGLPGRWCGPEAFDGAGGLSEAYAGNRLDCRVFEVEGRPCWGVLPITCPAVTIADPGFADPVLRASVQGIADDPCASFLPDLPRRQELPGVDTYGMYFYAFPNAWHALSCDLRERLQIGLPGSVRPAA